MTQPHHDALLLRGRRRESLESLVRDNRGIYQMRIDQLIYTSRVSSKFNYADIANILMVARKNNKALGVTGALCFEDDMFIQYLEGPTKELNQLSFKILRDPRHQDIQIRYYGESEKNLFGRWSMCEIEGESIASTELEEDDDVLFSSLSSSDALKMFERLSETMKSYS